MIQMKLTPDPNDPNLNILELKIKAPASPEPTPIPDVKIPNIIFIDDSIEESQLPQITHALTDTINRITWPEQIQVISSTLELPEHLNAKPLQNKEVFLAAESTAPCNLILITNKEAKELKKQIAKATEFLTRTTLIQPTTTIALIDNLNDHIQGLKQKTLVNLKIEIELPNNNTLKPLNYIPNLTKEGNTHCANLIDLASEEEKAYAFLTDEYSTKITFTYEDLLLQRRVQGGACIQVQASGLFKEPGSS